MSWGECNCDELQKHGNGVSLSLGVPSTISYGVAFSGSLKTNGKSVSQVDTLEGIYGAMNRYSEVANVNFIRSGSPRFIIRIQSHPVTVDT